MTRAAMRKGEDIARRGGVRRYGFRAPNEVEATVEGTMPYRLYVGRDEEGDTLVACTCPSFDRNGACKHLWALAIVLDDAGIRLERGPVPDAPPHADLIEPEGAEDENWYDEYDDEYDDDFVGASIDPIARLFGPARKDRKPWQDDLRKLGGEPPHPVDPFAHVAPKGTRLLYLLDVGHSRTSGKLQVVVAVQSLEKDGSWGRARRIGADSLQAQSAADGADRLLLPRLVRHVQRYSPPWGFGPRGDLPEPAPPARSGSLLEGLLASGRLFLAGPDGGPVGEALVLDEGPPWIFGLALEEGVRRGTSRLAGFLARGDRRMDLAEPELITPGFLVHRGVSRFESGGAFDVAAALRPVGPIEVPEEGRAAALALMLRQPEGVRVEIAGFERASDVAPVPHLDIAGPDSGRGMKTRFPCRIAFAYGGVRTDATAPGRYVADEEHRRLFERDRDAERRAVETFVEVGGLPPPASAPVGEARVLAKDLVEVVQTLLDRGWTVEADGLPYRRAGSFHLQVTSGVDWFDLEGGLDFSGQIAPLPRLLEAARRGSRTVRLGDGSLGLLPERWLEGWELAAGLATPEGEKLRFGASQGWALDALLAAQPDAAVDERFRECRERLRAFSGIEPAPAPKALRATLRGYQEEGLAWLRFLQSLGLGGCLADDMGLGKTIQVLALLLARKAGRGSRPPSLVVAPRSLVFHWKEEAQRFAPRLRVLDLTGPDRHARLEELGAADLAVTTYGTLRRDIVKLRDTRFDYAILDEAQAIKNPQSQAAKAARLLEADHRLALSGTPIENHLGELWSLFEFLNPGMLGRAKVFRELVGGANGQALSEAGRVRLATAIRPFVLRRTKEAVLDDLPAKTEQVLHCEMDAKQKRAYVKIRDHVRTALLAKLEEGSDDRMRFHVLEALLRLRQAACHVGLLDPDRRDEGSAKLDVLLPLLEEIRESGHKALVFSQFTSLLAIVRERLDGQGTCYEYLDGRTRDRKQRVARFQEDPDCPVFLISLKAGGLGLNLTAADYVFLLDPWWNPAVERQAVDRAHRIGQTRKVFAYRLITQDTVEEKVLRLQEQKRALAEAVIGGDRSALKDLTREDLLALFE